YRGRPEVAAYDLLNEPTGAATAAALIPVHDRLYKAIRQVDARHLIIVEDGYKGDDAFPAHPAGIGWQNVCFSKHHYRFDAKSPDVHRKVIADDLPKWKKRQQ